jgi:hypothetical protein
MGAGERMVRAVEAGKIRPTIVTLAISGALLIWAAYAASGAGMMARLPLTKPAIALISAICFARGLGASLLKPMFPENSDTFWLVSSGICLAIGSLYAYGLISIWASS